MNIAQLNQISKYYEMNGEHVVKALDHVNLMIEKGKFQASYSAAVWKVCMISYLKTDMLTKLQFVKNMEIFPSKEEWQGKLLFIETCEEKPTLDVFEKEIEALKSRGVFEAVNGIIVGKPQDEAYYEEYKGILVRMIDNVRLPIVYNVNFGHATPQCALQYGAMAKVDMKQKKIFVSK